MRKTRKLSKKAVIMMAGALALTGAASSVPAMGAVPGAITAQAASNEYSTAGGVATMGTGTASITITGNSGQTLTGKKFNVYKLFFAENSRDGESINYTFNPAYEQALKNVVAAALAKAGTQVSPADVTEYMVIDYIQTLNSNPVEGSQTGQTLEGSYSGFRYFVESLRDEIAKQGLDADTVTVKNTRNDNSIQLAGLDYGYYVVDEVSAVEGTHSASSLCMVNTANPAAQVNIKSDYPSITKKIQEDDKNQDVNGGITDADNWNDIGDYEIGQTVPYKYESNIPNMNGYDTYYYAWHDKMDSALTFNPKSVSITITGQMGGKEKAYTLSPDEYSVVTTGLTDGDTFKIEVKDIKAIVDREFDQINDLKENVYGQAVKLTYNATLNDSAADRTGRAGFENDVRLEFSNDADSAGSGKTGYTPWDTVVAFTYKLNVSKVNDHQKTLAGAKFRLYSDKDCKNEVYVKQGDKGYIVVNRDLTGGTDHTGGSAPADAAEMVSAEDGTFVIYGLDQGTYYLKETDAPDGYRLLKAPITLTVTPTFTEERDAYVKGDGATDKTLAKLDATAHIESFYDGALGKEDQTLATDVADGSANLTVVNKVGKKLPVTGTHAVLIMVSAGAALMAGAGIYGRRKKNEEI